MGIIVSYVMWTLPPPARKHQPQNEVLSPFGKPDSAGRR